jgi:hypothetical protein
MLSNLLVGELFLFFFGRLSSLRTEEGEALERWREGSGDDDERPRRQGHRLWLLAAAGRLLLGGSDADVAEEERLAPHPLAERGGGVAERELGGGGVGDLREEGRRQRAEPLDDRGAEREEGRGDSGGQWRLWRRSAGSESGEKLWEDPDKLTHNAHEDAGDDGTRLDEGVAQAEADTLDALQQLRLSRGHLCRGHLGGSVCFAISSSGTGGGGCSRGLKECDEEVGKEERAVGAGERAYAPPAVVGELEDARVEADVDFGVLGEAEAEELEGGGAGGGRGVGEVGDDGGER